MMCEEGEMVDGIKSDAEVKEDEDGETVSESQRREICMSLAIFCRAVSMLCLEHKTDCKGS